MHSHLHPEVCCCCTFSMCLFHFYYNGLHLCMIGCCFVMIHVRRGNQKGDEDYIHCTPTKEWWDVYLFHHGCLSVCLKSGFYILLYYLLSLDIQWLYFIHVLRLLPMIWWGLLFILGSKFKVRTRVWTLHHFAHQ